MADETIYLYGLGEGAGSKGARVEEAASSLGMRVVRIGECDLGITVGDLISRSQAPNEDAAGADASGMQRAAQSAPSPDGAPDLAGLEFMLMDGLDDDRMGKLLDALRQRDASVGCKCVVTSNNLTWRVDNLMRSVRKEHEVMTAYMELVKAYKRAAALECPDGADPSSWDALQAAIASAKSLLSSKEPHAPSEYREAEGALSNACTALQAGQ